MDAIESIHPEKDTTLLLLLAAQKRGFGLVYFEQGDLYALDGQIWGSGRVLTVFDHADHYFELDPEPEPIPLAGLSAFLMRKDPPVDLDYLYTNLLLQHAERDGLRIINSPAALLQTNEKLAILDFPNLIPPTLVTGSLPRLLHFIEQHQQVVLKPLDGMGGSRVFTVAAGDLNRHVIVEVLTGEGHHPVMAQRYIPEIRTLGDKRILLIDGQPVPYALARLPAPGEARGNLARGGTARGVELSARDQAICAHVGPVLARAGHCFVGLDVIGDYLTEINVTSPTCARELDRLYGLDIGGQFIDHLIRTLPRPQANP
jgi:glutathione synthase